MRYLIVAPILFVLGCGGDAFTSSNDSNEPDSGSDSEQQGEAGSHGEASTHNEASASETSTGNETGTTSDDGGLPGNDAGMPNDAGGDGGVLNCVELLASQPANVCAPYVGFVSLQFTRGANGTSENYLRAAIYDDTVAGQGLITTAAMCGASPLPTCYKSLSCASWDGSGTCGFCTKAPQCTDVNVTYTLGSTSASYASFIDPSTTQVQINSTWSVTLNGNAPILSNGTDNWTLTCQ